MTRYLTTTISALLLLAGTVLLANSAMAQALSDQITGIRIETEDCPRAACGGFYGSTQAELAAYLAADANERAAAQAIAASASSAGGKGKSNGQGLSLGHNNNAPQVVFLDFASAPPFYLVDDQLGIFGPPGIVQLPAHAFTQAERDAIQARLEADYAHLDYVFTQTPPTGDYTTLTFNCPSNQACITIFPNGGISILFGRADNIDWRNKDRSDNAFADVNFWSLTVALDPSGGFFSALTGLPVDPTDPASLAEQLSVAIVNQGSNTGAHEVGHIVGQRHHDSFGAPGDGLPPRPSSPQPGEFVPIYNGNQDAAETFAHIMASGASAGLSLDESANADRFFSERATVKHAISERGRLISEAAATGNSGIVKLHNLVVPNPLVTGENASGGLDADAIVIQGRIERAPGEEPESDVYRFKGKAGDFFNAEVISFTDILVFDPVIGLLSLYYVEGDGSLSLVDLNLQTFEPFDPLLFDIELPADGEYVLELSAPNFVYLPPPDDFFLLLDESGFGTFRSGDYELLMYIVDGKMGGGPRAVPGP